MFYSLIFHIPWAIGSEEEKYLAVLLTIIS